MAVAGISRALTWLQGADFLSPETADELFADVIRHRIYMNAAARRRRGRGAAYRGNESTGGKTGKALCF